MSTASPSTGPGAAAQLRQVVHPVADVGAAVAFYADALGLAPKFVDGDRYAALDAGGATLALAAPEEDVTGRAAAALKVADVDAALQRAVEAGATVVAGPDDGPHERRVVVDDPWGNRVVLYAAL